MEIEIILRGESKIQMPLEYIIDEINSQPLAKRFSLVSRMLNEIILTSCNSITIEQRAIIINFLLRYYEIYTGSFNEPVKSKKGLFSRIFKKHCNAN
jgi:hypothetical protein